MPSVCWVDKIDCTLLLDIEVDVADGSPDGNESQSSVATNVPAELSNPRRSESFHLALIRLAVLMLLKTELEMAGDD